MAVTTTHKGEAIFVDLSGKGSAKMLFKCASGTTPTAQTLDTMTDVLAIHSKCFLKTQKLLQNATEGEMSLTGNKKIKALIVAEEPNGSVHKWELPDPEDADIDGVAANVEDRFLKPATATLLVAAIATFTGLTLTAKPCPIFEY